MKKLLIVIPKMSMGGMERSAANLIKISNYTKNYKVTLMVGYVSDNSLFNDLPKGINVQYIWKGKWNIFTKILSSINFLKTYIFFMLKKRSAYDIAICYSHHHGLLSKLVRAASKNNVIFIHSDLSKARTKKQINAVKFDKFSRVACVSEASKIEFQKLFPVYDEKNVRVILNYIDGDKINSLCDERINDIDIDTYKEKGPIFVNVSRQIEIPKKISRIIKAVGKLKEQGYKFHLILIGNGPDSELYKQMVKELNIEDFVIFLGNKTNPYKYMKNSSALVFSSLYEGYGMVLDEARVLNVPFISTDVADAKIITKEGYGIICENTDDGIYVGMKKFLDEGYVIKNKFDYLQFNKKITYNLDELVKF